MSLIIKEIRIKTGMTQKAFSALFNIPLSTLRKWEQGEASPPPYVADLIARAIPAMDASLRVIHGNDGNAYYYDGLKKQIMDEAGNRITVGEDLEGVNEHNLGIYAAQLFSDFHDIQERFNRDCRYDKQEAIIWI
ncbi:MAG: helix-turn-helix domain-containing protein [Clostridia bacterium]|nr:helix-turn-helix domain-containing protein [Clostridia bacterium]